MRRITVTVTIDHSVEPEKPAGKLAKWQVSSILKIAWPAITRVTSKFTYQWREQVLRKAEAEGRLQYAALGPVYLHKGVEYPVQELVTPVAWTKTQENKNVLENDRIAFCSALMSNACWSHEFQLESLVKTHDIVLSKQYHMQMSEIFELSDFVGYGFRVYTAYVALPKGSLTV